MTPQQLSAAVKHELSQVKSIIRDLTPSTHDTEQHNKAEQARTTEEIRSQNLQLELKLTRAKLELIKLLRETVQFGTSPKAKLSKTTTTTAASSDPPPVKPTLKALQQDPAVHLRRTSVAGFD